jgi:hypothetical protein
MQGGGQAQQEPVDYEEVSDIQSCTIFLSLEV